MIGRWRRRDGCGGEDVILFLRRRGWRKRRWGDEMEKMEGEVGLNGGVYVWMVTWRVMIGWCGTSTYVGVVGSDPIMGCLLVVLRS